MVISLCTFSFSPQVTRKTGTLQGTCNSQSLQFLQCCVHFPFHRRQLCLLCFYFAGPIISLLRQLQSRDRTGLAPLAVRSIPKIRADPPIWPRLQRRLGRHRYSLASKLHRRRFEKPVTDVGIGRRLLCLSRAFIRAGRLLLPLSLRAAPSTSRLLQTAQTTP